jgi:ACT domain-containing protein
MGVVDIEVVVSVKEARVQRKKRKITAPITVCLLSGHVAAILAVMLGRACRVLTVDEMESVQNAQGNDANS